LHIEFSVTSGEATDYVGEVNRQTVPRNNAIHQRHVIYNRRYKTVLPPSSLVKISFSS